MFETLPCQANNGFWLAQHQITAGAYLVRGCTGGTPLNRCLLAFCSPAGEQGGILTDFQTKVKEKMDKRKGFFGRPLIVPFACGNELRTRQGFKHVYYTENQLAFDPKFRGLIAYRLSSCLCHPIA